MFSFSTCSWDGEEQHRWRLDEGARARKAGIEEAARAMQECTPTFFNSCFDLTFTERLLGYRLRPKKFHDVQTMIHILDSDRTMRSLKELAWELGGYPIDDAEEVRGRHTKNYSWIPKRVMDEYQRRDAERTMLLHRTLYRELHSSPYLSCYQEEIELIRTTMDIESRGIRISIPKTEEMREELRSKSEAVYDQITKEVGRPIKPRSEDDLARVLYKERKLPILKRTSTGKPSVDKTALTELSTLLALKGKSDPLLDLTLQYRSYTGAEASLTGYLNLCSSDGTLHPEIRTCGARTGRESSANPNLQNVQKETSPRNRYPIPVGQCFYPNEDEVLYLLDLSGIEMRMLVHYSQDPIMLKAFLEGEDPHDIAAAVWYRKAYTRCTDPILKKVMRGAAKNANFAKHYGAALLRIALTLELPVEIVRELMKDYDRRFPGARSLFQRVRREVEQKGCIHTLFGRKIDVPAAKPYIGVNYLIQGSCADLFKRIQNRVNSYLSSEVGLDYGIVMPIHDELILSLPRTLSDRKQRRVIGEVASLMTTFPEVSLPLGVECRITETSWADARDYAL